MTNEIPTLGTFKWTLWDAIEEVTSNFRCDMIQWNDGLLKDAPSSAELTNKIFILLRDAGVTVDPEQDAG